MEETSTSFINKTAIVEEGSIIGNNVTIGNYTHIKSESEIAENSIVGQNVVVSSGVLIGRNCEIQNNVCFHQGVICEDDVFIGHSAVFTTSIFPHKHATVNQKRAEMITVVQKGAKIGANSTIVCGISIGKYSFITAGSVVLNDVKDYAIITGNPSKQTGWMSEHGSKMNFLNHTRTAICKISGLSYKFEHNGVRRIN